VLTSLEAAKEVIQVEKDSNGNRSRTPQRIVAYFAN